MSTNDGRKQASPSSKPNMVSVWGRTGGGSDASIGNESYGRLTPTSAAQISLLGDVGISCTPLDGPALVTISNSKARLVFALLSMHQGTAVSRDRLADELWPDQVPDSWGAALRNVVSRVRTSLRDAFGVAGEEMLISINGAYVLQLPTDALLDVDHAQKQLVRAHDCLLVGDADQAAELAESAVLALRQPLLAEHDGTWVNGVRNQLTEQLVVGLETLSRASLLRGNETHALVRPAGRCSSPLYGRVLTAA